MSDLPQFHQLVWFGPSSESPLAAYPTSLSTFADWELAHVEIHDFSLNGKFVASVDKAYGYEWAIFPGSGGFGIPAPAPTSWDQALDIVQIPFFPSTEHRLLEAGGTVSSLVRLLTRTDTLQVHIFVNGAGVQQINLPSVSVPRTDFEFSFDIPQNLKPGDHVSAIAINPGTGEQQVFLSGQIAQPSSMWSGALLEADRTYPWMVRYPSVVENPSLAIRLNGVVAETVPVVGSGHEHVFPVLIPPYAERGDTVMVETTEPNPRPVILGQVIRTINSMSLGQGSFRVRVEVEDGVAPVDGAVVNILDSNEDPIGVYGRTVNGGSVEFNLDPGAYRAVITSMSGFQPHSPVPFAVVDESVVVNLLFERFNVTEAEDPELCNVYAVVRNIDGTPSVGSPVVATVEGTPPMLDGSVISSVSMSANTDGNGIARLTLIRSDQFVLGGRYEITAGDRVVRYWVPDQSAAILTLELAVPQ